MLLHPSRRSGKVRGAAMGIPTTAPCCSARLHHPTLTTTRVNFYQTVANVSLTTAAEETLCFPGQARSRRQPCFAPPQPTRQAIALLCGNKVVTIVIVLEKQNGPYAITCPAVSRAKAKLHVWGGRARDPL